MSDIQNHSDVHIINGPNLNLVGVREPGVYGDKSFENFIPVLRETLAKTAPALTLHYHQSNVEGELIDLLQTHGFSPNTGIVLNAGGYTHTSVALRDAVAAIQAPVVEVHISNIHSREDFRHVSLLSPVCAAVVCGLGLSGYESAVNWLAASLAERFTSR
jgi:3-dehydroquinate dehydratase-2